MTMQEGLRARGCRADLEHARLLGEGRASHAVAGQVSTATHRLANNPETGCRRVIHYDSLMGNGKFELCPGQTASRTG